MLWLLSAMRAGLVKKARKEHRRSQQVEASFKGLHDENMEIRKKLQQAELREDRADKDHARCVVTLRVENMT